MTTDPTMRERPWRIEYRKSAQQDWVRLNLYYANEANARREVEHGNVGWFLSFGGPRLEIRYVDVRLIPDPEPKP